MPVSSFCPRTEGPGRGVGDSNPDTPMVMGRPAHNYGPPWPPPKDMPARKSIPQLCTHTFLSPHSGTHRRNLPNTLLLPRGQGKLQKWWAPCHPPQQERMGAPWEGQQLSQEARHFGNPASHKDYLLSSPNRPSSHGSQVMTSQAKLRMPSLSAQVIYRMGSKKKKK